MGWRVHSAFAVLAWEGKVSFNIRIYGAAQGVTLEVGWVSIAAIGGQDGGGGLKSDDAEHSPIRMRPLGVYCGGGGPTDALSENCEETTPFMWRDKLAVVEHHHPFRVRWQSHEGLPASATSGNNSLICASIPGTDWVQYASAVVVNGTLWVFGTNDVAAAPPEPNGRERTQVHAFWSSDPLLSPSSWRSTRILQLPQSGTAPTDPDAPLPWWTAYNTDPTKGVLGGKPAWFLAIELDTPQSLVPTSHHTGQGYLSIFAMCRQCAETDDLSFGWEILSPTDHVYRRDRYSACPTLRYFDGWFYIVVLFENVPSPRGPYCGSNGRRFDGCLASHVARSKDLVTWQEGGLIMGLPDGNDTQGPDHRIIPGSLLDQLGSDNQKTIAHNQTDDVNRSDMDFVTLPTGQTYLVWNTGNQGEATPPNPPAGFSGAGLVDGTEQEWLESFFAGR